MIANHDERQVAGCLVRTDPAIIGKLQDLFAQVSAMSAIRDPPERH